MPSTRYPPVQNTSKIGVLHLFAQYLYYTVLVINWMRANFASIAGKMRPKPGSRLMLILNCCRVLRILLYSYSYQVMFYLHPVTYPRQVGAIGGNLIYGIKNTEMFAIKPADAASGTLSSSAAHGTDSNAFVSTLAKVNRRLNPTPR